MDNASPDLSGMLGKLLENPETLKSAMEIAAKLKSTGILDGAKEQSEKSYDAPPDAYSEVKNANGPEASVPRAAETGSSAGDERAKRRMLLGALRPYMSRERQEKIDTILKVLKLLEIAEQLGVIGKVL